MSDPSNRGRLGAALVGALGAIVAALITLRGPAREIIAPIIIGPELKRELEATQRDLVTENSRLKQRLDELENRLANEVLEREARLREAKTEQESVSQEGSPTSKPKVAPKPFSIGSTELPLSRLDRHRMHFAGSYQGPKGMRSRAWRRDAVHLAYTQAGNLGMTRYHGGFRLVRKSFEESTYLVDVCWTNEGQLLIGARQSEMLIWNFASTQLLSRRHLSGYINDIDCRGDGIVLAGTRDGQMIVVNVETDEKPRYIRHNKQEAALSSVAWSPNGTLAATASHDATAIVWDPLTSKKRQKLHHEGIVSDLAWAPSSHFLATASADYTVAVWQIGVENPVRKLPHDGEVLKVAWSPKGGHLLTVAQGPNSRYASLWSLSNPSNEPVVTQDIPEGSSDMAWHPGGEFVVLGDERWTFR